MSAADPMASFSTTDDALVLASVSSPAERELLNDWLQRQRREHPESNVEVLRASRRTIRRRECWPGSSRSSRPTRTARWFRCGCSGCRRPAHPLEGGRADLRPRHLSSAGGSAAPHPANGSVARAGGGRRAREGLRAAPAVERHHRRRKPPGIRAFRDPTRDPGHRTRRAAVARAGVQVAASWSSRRCWRRRGSARVWSRFPAPPSRRPARCSTNSPPGGAGSPST